MTRRPLLALLLVLAAGLVGCDTAATTPEAQVVVEAYLQANAPMDSIRLTRSVGTQGAYVPSEAAIRNAEVTVRRLNDDGTPAATIPYRESASGVYAPAPTPRPLVQPLTTYELSVTTPDGAEVTAQTTVPDTLSIVDSKNEEVVYQGETQPTFTVTPPRSARAGQAVLVLTTTSLVDFGRPESQLRDRLTPFYEEDYDPEEDNVRSFRQTSSGVLNEANFTRDDAGRITTKLPWISVAFYGPNRVAVHVIDENLYDLVRSQQAQTPGQGGGGLGPGEIPNVIEHVEGGTGIFGSYARDTREVTIQRPASDPLE
jgi:hypothetical protein